MKLLLVFSILLVTSILPAFAQQNQLETNKSKPEDFLTPEYYLSKEKSVFKTELERFILYARKVPFQHPLIDSSGNSPDFMTPFFGTFGAGKGPDRNQQHHPAIDFKVENNATKVSVFAAHDGIVHLHRDAPKYRQAISITIDITDESGKKLGKMVSIYGHVDLDLDSVQNLVTDGQFVKRGDLISKNLWSGTRGGPHLHFEIRYYRPGDLGTEDFYGFIRPGRSNEFTQTSAGSWSFGAWNPAVGYGFAHPENHFSQMIFQPD